MEVWKAVEGYESGYEISSYGALRSLDRLDIRGQRQTGRLLKPTMSYAYLAYELCHAGERKPVKAHRLVAATFIPNPENKPQVNHIDGDKLNNQVNNLEWVTHRENIQHAYDTGLMPIGTAKTNSKLTNLDVHYIIWWDEAGMTNREIATTLGVGKSTVGLVLTGERFKHVDRVKLQRGQR